MTNAPQLDRRTLLKTLAFTSLASAFGVASAEAGLHQPLPAWSEGHFDIHHIDTARGNATLLIFPDGTTLLLDAGSVTAPPEGTANPARPNGTTLRPGEVIANYIAAHAPKPSLDYFLATHIHPDHIDGLYDVAVRFPIATFIDRSFPHYAANQQPLGAPFAQKYTAFLAAHPASVQAARVGSTDQITPRVNPSVARDFRARILAANGNVWNATTGKVEAHLANVQASENNFSIALRFDCGRFSYYTGGDLDADTFDGRMPALDTETPVARSCGRVEVAVANHHGYFDACGPAFVQALDPQAWIIPSWDIGHPGSAQMQRMEGAWDANGGKATHDVFALELLPQNALTNRRFSGQLKSQLGHVVVRVAPGGNTYTLYTLDPTVEHGTITGIFGPYTSRT